MVFDTTAQIRKIIRSLQEKPQTFDCRYLSISCYFFCFFFPWLEHFFLLKKWTSNNRMKHTALKLELSISFLCHEVNFTITPLTIWTYKKERGN